MNADRLVEIMKTRGLDDYSFSDRFSDNANFYSVCFMKFLEEESFERLDQAIAAKDWESAFGAAHAIKGLAANLCIDDLHDSISALVDALRSGQAENVDALYASFKQHLAYYRTL